MEENDQTEVESLEGTANLAEPPKPKIAAANGSAKKTATKKSKPNAKRANIRR